MTLDEVRLAVRSLSLQDKAQLRLDLRDMIQLEAAESEYARQRDCKHLRAKEGEPIAGLVTWYCPDCHARRTLSHYREGGMK